MRTFVLFIAAAVSAAAQSAPGPAVSILVSGPQSRIVHGDTVRFTAVARDSSFQPRSGDNFTWTVGDANVLSVDNQGNVTAKGLGFSEVRANLGGLRGAVNIQVTPSKIIVTPGTKTMTAGERMQFRASVRDVRGEEIPNVNLTWDIMNAELRTTVVASIDRNGMVSTAGAGQFFVRARYNYSGQTSPFVPYVEGIATIDVRLKTSHRLREMTSTWVSSQTPVLRPRRTLVSANESGQIVFQGELDGISNGLLMYDRGELTPLAVSGTQGPVPTGFIYEFQNFAINDKGQVLSRALVAGSSHGLLIASKDSSDWYGVEGMYLGSIENLNSFYVTRSSLNNDGEAVIRAAFRLTGETVSNVGLFRFRANGSIELVASTIDGVPGLKGPITFENDFGIANDGTVYFRATGSGETAIFRQPANEAPVRVIGIGDTLGNLRITNLPGTTYLSFLVSPGGDLTTLATLSNNTTVMLHFPPGAKTPRQTTYRAMYGIFAARDGNVLWYGDSGSGAGLQIWKPDGTHMKSIGHTQSIGGDSVIWIDGGALTAKGETVAVVRGEKRPFAIVRGSASGAEVLAEPGMPVKALAQLTFTSMIPGMKVPGNPLVQGAGDPWNLVEIRGQDAVPVIKHGDRFDGNVVVYGFSFNNVRRTPNGDTYLFVNPFGVNVPNYGVYKYDNGTLKQTIKYNFNWPDGTQQYLGNFYGASDSGYLLISGSTSRSHSRLFLWKDNAPVLVATTLDELPFGSVIGWDNAVVTETGKVMVNFRFRNAPNGLYVWENGKWTEQAVINKSRILDLNLTSIGTLRAVGDHLYAGFGMSGGGSALAEWVDGKWNILVSHNDNSPTGQPMAGIGNFDVNRKGEIAFLSNSFSWPNMLFRDTDGKLSIVSYTFDLDNLQSQLIRYVDLDLRDDGTIYFIGLDLSERYVLFEATR